MYTLWNCCIAEVVVSPPYVFLPVVKSQLRPEFQVAAQNCWVKKGGAFTGEVRLVFISLLAVHLIYCNGCLSVSLMTSSQVLVKVCLSCVVHIALHIHQSDALE